MAGYGTVNVAIAKELYEYKYPFSKSRLIFMVTEFLTGGVL